MALKDLHTCSLSSGVFALRKGFKSWCSMLMEQRYRYVAMRRKNIVRFRLRQRPSLGGFSFLGSQFLERLAEFSFWNCSRRQLNKSLVEGSLQEGSTCAGGCRRLTLFRKAKSRRDNPRRVHLVRKNLGPCFLVIGSINPAGVISDWVIPWLVRFRIGSSFLIITKTIFQFHPPWIANVRGFGYNYQYNRKIV